MAICNEMVFFGFCAEEVRENVVHVIVSSALLCKFVMIVLSFNLWKMLRLYENRRFGTVSKLELSIFLVFFFFFFQFFPFWNEVI